MSEGWMGESEMLGRDILWHWTSWRPLLTQLMLIGVQAGTSLGRYGLGENRAAAVQTSDEIRNISLLNSSILAMRFHKYRRD